MSLAMAELAAALPDEGGYVAWVRRAFGPFWGFQVGWWSWINCFVDVAVYPALFADYLDVLVARHVAGRRAGRSCWPSSGSLTGAQPGRRAHHGLDRGGAGRGRAGAGGRLHRGGGCRAPSTCRGCRSPPGEGSLVAGPGPRARRHDVELLGLGQSDARASARRAPRATAFRRALFVALPLIALAYVLPVAAALVRRPETGRSGTPATARCSRRRSAGPRSAIS